MNIRMARHDAADEKMWYCLEFYDEATNSHSFSTSYTTEDNANRIILEADRMAPLTTHIYYWRTLGRPFLGPPGGHNDGPLAERGK